MGTPKNSRDADGEFLGVPINLPFSLKKLLQQCSAFLFHDAACDLGLVIEGIRVEVEHAAERACTAVVRTENHALNA